MCAPHGSCRSSPRYRVEPLFQFFKPFEAAGCRCFRLVGKSFGLQSSAGAGKQSKKNPCEFADLSGCRSVRLRPFVVPFVPICRNASGKIQSPTRLPPSMERISRTAGRNAAPPSRHEIHRQSSWLRQMPGAPAPAPVPPTREEGRRHDPSSRSFKAFSSSFFFFFSGLLASPYISKFANRGPWEIARLVGGGRGRCRAAVVFLRGASPVPIATENPRNYGARG